MRQLLRVGLAVVAVSSGPVAADPATPQLSPLHRQREDAQRLQDQHRDLEQAQPAVAPPAIHRAPAVPAGDTRHTTRNAGLVLLGVAGVSAIVALPLSASDDSSDNTLSDLLFVTAAITATGGIVLVLSDRSYRVAPTVTARSVGVTLMGRI
jgi:hypothetical protein